MKKFTPLLIVLFAINLNSYSQINPSVYVGYGNGTNIGGNVGIGTEIKYKMFSANAAIGSWIDEFPEHTGAKNRFDYDFGVKIYSKIGIFAGVNYGLISTSLYTKNGQEKLHFEKVRAFSFTIGYRRTIYKNLYGLVFLGLTSNKDENYIKIFDEEDFFPRIGLLIGFELNKKNK